MVVVGQGRKIQPASNPRGNVLRVVGALMEEEVAICLCFFLSFVENGMELVSSDIVCYFEVV